MRFALLGGDDRFVHLCALLRADGHAVRPFALERALPDCAGTAEAALADADCVLLPLPCEKGGVLNAPLSAGTFAPAEVLRHAAPGVPVLAGKPGRATADACLAYDLALTDYGAREDFALRNADLTAEGALALLLDGPKSLRDSRFLVAGYGRIGRLLAAKLTALGASVTVAARSAAARAAAELAGCASVSVEAAPRDGWDAVMNTIPEVVFDGAAIGRFGGARLIELASPPYGFDSGAANAQGKPILLASGLPGKTAPQSAAAAVQKTIYAILEERT